MPKAANAMKISALAGWYGGNRLLAAKPAAALDETALAQAVERAKREIDAHYQARERQYRAAVQTYQTRMGRIAEIAAQNSVHLPEEVQPVVATPKIKPALPKREFRAPAALEAPAPNHKTLAVRTDTGKLGKGERVVLSAIAQYPEGAPREQLTVLTGYKRSSRDAYLQRLREKGLVQDGERITATDTGIATLGADFQPLPTGDALREHWLKRLPEGERRVLECVIAAHPYEVERDAIDGATGYKRSSRDAYLQRLQARMLVKAERGMVRAADELFD